MQVRDRSELQRRADCLVGCGEALCRQQAALIASWRALGHETEAAEALLVRLELSLTRMQLYRAHLEADA